MNAATAIPTKQQPAWLGAAALLVASWIAIAELSLHVRAGTEVVAAAFPPWWSGEQALLAAASANALIVRTTAIPAVLVVRPASEDGMNRLYRAGAWLAIDPQAIAACFKTDERSGGDNGFRRQ
jgi:hypothetical protein